LALRGFGKHDKALKIFRTARLAYTSPQIENAHAQQLLINAERAASWETAEPLILEAVENFRDQQQETWETDTYPIVALAEGHVASFRKSHSVTGARELARG
jgi:hypothetical protein